MDVYTKVIKKHPAAVVLHAPKKQHMFMSYDGLFIQRKGLYYLRMKMRKRRSRTSIAQRI